jgi:hypothetical protein
MLAGLLALSWFPVGANAQTLPNSVSCVYDALLPEQREIGQYLLIKTAGETNPFKLIEQPGELKSLLDEGIDRCIGRYPWPMGKTKSSQYYALVMLMRDTLQLQLELDGHPPLMIEAYVETNSNRWKIPRPSTPAEEAAAVAHFRSIGWTITDSQQERGISGYFGLSVLLMHLRRGFTAGQFYR